MIANDAYEELEACKVLFLTSQAVKVNFEGTIYWVPLSVIEDDSEIELFADIDLCVERWFCLKNEIL